jgi:hypothetical protein
MIEDRIAERHVGCVGLPEIDRLFQAASACQFLRNIHALLCEIDAGNPTAQFLGKETGRPPDTAPDLEDMHSRANFGMFRMLPRCIDAPCMHLIAHVQVFVRRVLGVDPL